MRRAALGGLVCVVLLAPVRADDHAKPPASAPLPKVPDLPPTPQAGSDHVNPEWKKADTPKTLPDLPAGTKQAPDDPAPPASKAAAPPPAKHADSTPDPVKKLTEELGDLARERDALTKPAKPDASGDERARLRAQLLDTVKRLENQRKAAAAPKPADPNKGAAKDPHPPTKYDIPDGTKPVDPMRLAVQVYKLGDADAALRAFALVDTTVLGKEDRAFTQYMTACCLRQTGKASEAAKIYRDITETKDDPFLTECALWQLAAIRSTQELESQLEQLRSRRKAK
jgi:hypothetical protein